MKLRDVRIKVIEEAAAADLQTEVTDFVQSTGSYTAESKERSFLSITVEHNGTAYFATILYTG